MRLLVNIVGDGVVTGAGEYLLGEIASLVAKPAPPSNFSHWEDGSTNDLRSLVAGEDDITVTAYFVLTIEDYLRGRVRFEVTDENLASVRLAVNIPYQADVTTLSERDRDVAYARLLIQATTMPSVIRGDEIRQGNRAFKQGGSTLLTTDRDRLRAEADEILRRYGLIGTDVDPNSRW